MGATYRSDDGQERALEARVVALSPATRERLTEAFERGEALAYRRPALIEHPVRWLLLGVFGAVLLVGPLAQSFGHIDRPLFARHTVGGAALLLAGCVWGLACGALAVRSLVLRRGELPSGLFLFATSLIESREGRLRLWPTSRLRSIKQREKLATLDLGPDGRVQLTTEDHDLSYLLGQLREQHHDAQLHGHTSTLVALDPVHAERARGTLTPIGGPATLTDPEASSARTRLAWVASGLLVLAMSVGLSVKLRNLSDWLGIELARRNRDSESLQAYAQTKNPLAEQAEEAWFEELRSQDSTRLLEYLHAPPPRSERLVTAVDTILARRLDEWTTSALDASQSVVITELQGYLAVGLPSQPLRPRLEAWLVDRSIAATAHQPCEESGEVLRVYIARPDALGDRAREAWWRRALDRTGRCVSYEDLRSAQAMATTPARQAEFAAAWAEFFHALQTRAEEPTTLFSEPKGPAVPGPIAAQMDRLWVYLAAHPEALLTERSPDTRTSTLVDVRWTVGHSHGWNRMSERLTQSMSKTQGMKVQGTVSYLQVRPIPPLHNVPSLLVESVLTLPGSAPQVVRVAIPCDCEAKFLRAPRGPLILR